MNLFKYINNTIVVDDNAYGIPIFRKIYDRDKSKTKDKAIQEFTYIYFMCDPRSDYLYISDEGERSNQVISDQGMGKWKPDEVVKSAMNLYTKFLPPSSLMYQDTLTIIDKIRKFYKEVDLTATNDRGQLLFPLNTVMSAIKSVPQILKDLDKAYKETLKDMTESNGIRGKQEKSMYEDD